MVLLTERVSTSEILGRLLLLLLELTILFFDGRRRRSGSSCGRVGS